MSGDLGIGAFNQDFQLPTVGVNTDSFEATETLETDVETQPFTAQARAEDLQEDSMVLAKADTSVNDKSVGEQANEAWGEVDGTSTIIADRRTNELSAWSLGPVSGGPDDSEKIANHVKGHIFSKGSPSTVEIGTARGIVDVQMDKMLGNERPPMPSNVYVITADQQGRLYASPARSGDNENVVGVAILHGNSPNPKEAHTVEIMRISDDKKVALTLGEGNKAVGFDPSTRIANPGAISDVIERPWLK